MAVAQAKPAEQEIRPDINWGMHETAVPEFTKDQEFLALRQMLQIRRFEEKAGQMYGM